MNILLAPFFRNAFHPDGGLVSILLANSFLTREALAGSTTQPPTGSLRYEVTPFILTAVL